ncbi:MAG: 3-deoxy-D-manno-octulosonic acid transferase [Hyphomicrobiales bacterium]
MSDLVSRLALNIYGGFGYVAMPFAGAFVRWRAAKGKEDLDRIKERYGYASVNTSNRICIWVHAASLGETRAVLPLIRHFIEMRFEVVFTTVTVTAARIAEIELPKGATHQYAPLDLKPFLKRFLKHWKPSIAIFVESELWPTTIMELSHQNIPQVLVNARMSARSFKRWKQFDVVSNALFENISLSIAQTKEDAARFKELGIHSVINSGNLKFDSDLPEVDVAQLAKLQEAIGERPVWLAASTHDREELIVAKAHILLKRIFPNLLTIIAPRHPNRAEKITNELTAMNLKVGQRSTGALPAADEDIYIADTIGELGLFYRLAPCSLIGGSLVPHGGQNPIEPARLGSAIIHGPNVANFSNIYDVFAKQGGCLCVHNSEELVRGVAALLRNSEEIERITVVAKSSLSEFSGALERTNKALMPYLNPLIITERLAENR